MVTIEVKADKVRDFDNVHNYLNLMNGIVLACHKYGEYQEGRRNQVAVDFTVGCYMLGLNPLAILGTFIEKDLINPSNDDEDTYVRIDRVLDYTERFNWDWMIEPEAYVYGASKINGEVLQELPVLFELVD